ncbi:hypothetical protein KCV03_g9968, partial [Aureobasidium melanogenum]
MANEIQRVSGFDEGLGREYSYQFFKRSAHCGSLNGDSRETTRVSEATEEDVRAWFDLFSSYRDEYRVQDANIHNMDEHGLYTGKIDPREVVGATYDQWVRTRKGTKLRSSRTRKWVSIVECISAGQTSTQPLIALENFNTNIGWTSNDPPPYKYPADPFAWIDDASSNRRSANATMKHLLHVNPFARGQRNDKQLCIQQTSINISRSL